MTSKMCIIKMPAIGQDGCVNPGCTCKPRGDALDINLGCLPDIFMLRETEMDRAGNSFHDGYPLRWPQKSDFMDLVGAMGFGGGS